MICKNVVLNRLLCYRRAKVKVEFMQESIYFEFQDRILLCQCYWVVCTHNKNIYLQKFSFKSKKKSFFIGQHSNLIWILCDIMTRKRGF